MSETDTRKVGLGLLLLAVSTVLVFGPGTAGLSVPAALVAAGTLGMAAAALLVGTSEPGRPV